MPDLDLAGWHAANPDASAVRPLAETPHPLVETPASLVELVETPSTPTPKAAPDA